jgi:tRNA dimethylallyltransferase
MNKLLVFIVGPTGVGKTELATQLARLLKSVEIISCDSMAVYREMKIGIAKPSKEVREEFPHWMIDIKSAKEEFNVFEYISLTCKKIEEVLERGNIPIIVGGSVLYFYSLIDGIFEEPSQTKELRKKLLDTAKEKGVEFLYNELRKCDPISAKKIHHNDLRRIVRALEVYYITGKPISELQKGREGLDKKYDIIIYGLKRKRDSLYNRINKRVDEMFEKGLLEEVEELYRNGLSKTAYQAHGYKEVIGYLEGKYSFEEAKRLTKRNTRRHAKRQLSWLRRDKRINWVNLDDFKMIKDAAAYIYQEIIRRV